MNSFAELMKGRLYLLLTRRLLGRVDGMVIGFPKTGNTWFNVMLRRTLVDRYGLAEEELSTISADKLTGAELDRIKALAPAIHPTHHLYPFHAVDFRRMKLDPAFFRNQRVALLIRNPGDTMVSFYMQAHYRNKRFKGSLEQMLKSPYFGLEKYIEYYRQCADLMDLATAVEVVRYEDMKADANLVFGRAYRMLTADETDPSIIEKAVNFGSFNNMKKMEQTNALKTKNMAPSGVDDPKADKVRKGLIGDYVNHIPAEAIQWMDRLIAQRLPEFYGYPLKEMK